MHNIQKTNVKFKLAIEIIKRQVSQVAIEKTIIL